MARALAQPVPLRGLVARFGGRLEPEAAQVSISRLAPLDSAEPGDLSFLASARHKHAAGRTRASAVIVSRELAQSVAAEAVRLIADDPLAHFARVARWYEREVRRAAGPASIDPSATVSPGAALGARVRVGPNCVIEDGAVIGDDCAIGANTTLGRGVRVGAGSVLHASVVVYDDCAIGARCVVHSGTVIGSDGFGFAPENGAWSKVPQLGAVRIGDDVEIGSNCSIDRGALEDTLIGNGCKLDNLIQIAHNVRVGEHTAIAACVGVAGSAVIGRRCMIGGAAMVLGHLEICDDVVLSPGSAVTSSITAPGFYSGLFPLMTNARWERTAAILRHLPELRRQVRTLGHPGRLARGGGAGDENED